MLTCALLLATADASARPGRDTQIPNNPYGCDICHTAAGGLNDFGFDSFDFTNNSNQVNWSGLSQLDSDADGYSNGLELADPNGTGANTGGRITHPGDPNSGLCGNHELDGNEECEQDILNGETCESMGLIAGTLSCNDSCRYDTSRCDSCGDNTIQGNEECDGTDLNGNTCESLGRGTGTLSCTGCSYNYVGCEGAVVTEEETCGDGIRQATEACDGADLNGQTCATMGYKSGVLRCAVRCTFDTTECVNTAEPATPSDEAPAANQVDENSRSFQGRACASVDLTSRGASSPTPLLLLAGLFALRRRTTR